MTISEYLESKVTSKNSAIVEYVRQYAYRDEIPQPVALVAMVSAGIIKQLSFPSNRKEVNSGPANMGKEGNPILTGRKELKLSPQEIQDIIGIVSLTLAKWGCLEAGEATREAWNDCFSEVRKNETGLNLNHVEKFDLSVLYGQEFNLSTEAKIRIRNRRALIRRYIDASNRFDLSRQAAANYKKALRLLDDAYCLAKGEGTLRLPAVYRDALAWNDTASQAEKTKETDRAKTRRNQEKNWFLAYIARGREAIKSGLESATIANPVIL